MTKEQLIAQLEGAKTLTSVVSIDTVVALIQQLDDAKAKVSDSFISEEFAQRISTKIEQALDYNSRDFVDTDTAEFSLGYDCKTIELDSVEINTYEIMKHVDAILFEFTNEDDEDEVDEEESRQLDHEEGRLLADFTE